MRWCLAFVGICGLACASGPTALKTVDRSALTIDLIDGNVTTDSDLGNDGDYDVDVFNRSQALSWGVEEPDLLVEQWAYRMASVMETLFANELGGNPTATVPERVTVAGHEGWVFEIPFDGSLMQSTSWRCPETGLRVTLNTVASPASEARSLHQRSLDSAVCKTTPVTAVANNAPSYVFQGGASWEQTDDAGEGVVTWTHRNGTTLRVIPTSDMSSPMSVCRSIMEVMVSEMDDLQVKPGTTAFAPGTGGCTYRLEAEVDGTDTKVRMVHDGCGGRGFVSICQSPSDPKVCEGRVVCVP